MDHWQRLEAAIFGKQTDRVPVAMWRHYPDEDLDPDKLTAATDQYSLGVILYQLLTAKLPFDGGIHGVLAAILTKDPTPPGQLRSDVNPHLEAICLKMMAKEAKDRYPSMKAVADVIPASVLNRRKVGFDTPAEAWMKGRHAGFVRELLTSRAARHRGLWNTAALSALLDRPDDPLWFDVTWKAVCIETRATLTLDHGDARYSTAAADAPATPT